MRRYKGVKVNSFGIPLISEAGERTKHIVNKRFYLKTFSGNAGKNAPKNLLVIYDIPEPFKKERDWFRRQLINLDFTMIQKSVWVGPSPLPEEFIKYLKDINLRQNFKTFKLAKSYKM